MEQVDPLARAFSAGISAADDHDVLRAGQPLAPVDIQYQLVMGKDGPPKTVLKLMLAARPRL